MARKEYESGENIKVVNYFAEEAPMNWKRNRDQKLRSSSKQLDKDHLDTMMVAISTRGKSPTPLHCSKAVVPSKSSVISSSEQSDDDCESFPAHAILSQIEGPPLLRVKEYNRLHKLWKSSKKAKKQDSEKEVIPISEEESAKVKDTEKSVPETSSSLNPKKPSESKRLRKANAVTQKSLTPKKSSDIILCTRINLNKPPKRKKYRLLKDIYDQE